MQFAGVRPAYLGLGLCLAAAVVAVEHGNRVDLAARAPAERVDAERTRVALITCPLRQPDFATVMQAAVLGDGMLIVEQQTATKVRHIKDC